MRSRADALLGGTDMVFLPLQREDAPGQLRLLFLFFLQEKQRKK